MTPELRQIAQAGWTSSPRRPMPAGAARRTTRRRPASRASCCASQEEYRAASASWERERADVDDSGRRARHRRSWSRSITGIPVNRMLEGEADKLLQMEERLHDRVIGQDEAIVALSDAIRRARAGLKDPRRPIGSFIFLGPTGVGKTELAKALAEFMFDDEDALIRVDMSRVPGAAHRLAPDRRASRLRRLRRGRRSDRGGAAAALPGGPVRRDREGAPGRVQHAAAGAGRRAADRRPGPHGGLPQHRGDHDQQPRHRRVRTGELRLRDEPARRRRRRAAAAGAAVQRALRETLPARVPEPDRRDHRLRAADRDRSCDRSST